MECATGPDGIFDGIIENAGSERYTVYLLRGYRRPIGQNLLFSKSILLLLLLLLLLNSRWTFVAVAAL